MRPRSYTLPLVALGTTLFFLVAGIVVVVAGRAGAGAGSCIVGTWDVIRHEEDVPLGAGLGTVKMIGSGNDATLILRSDGTGVADYGSAAEYYGIVGEQTVKLVVSGRVTFRYVAEDGTVTLSDVDVGATGQAYIDGVATGEPAALTPTGSSTYTCQGDSLVENSGLATIRYERRT